MKRTRLGRDLGRLVGIANFLNRHPEISFNQFEEMQLESRRQFLKNSALAAGAILASPLFLPACSPVTIANQSKVIILGAGMAGLSAAFYLTRAGVPCAIYESASRTGGRMFTQYDFNHDGMHCELGGELVDSNNQDLFALCKEFQIKVDVFAAEDKGLEQNLYFIKNKYYTDHDLIPAFQKFAKHLEIAKKSNPEKIDKLSLEEFLSEMKDVEPWVIEVLRVAYVGESGLEAGDQSALMMVSTIDGDFSHGAKFFGDSDEAMHIHGGNAALTTALEKYLRSRGVEIHLSTPLISIKETAQKLELSFKKDATEIHASSDRVICTIPFSKLREVEGIFSLNLNPLKKICIQETAYGTNGKLIMGFQQRLWRRSHGHRPASNGMTYTDLYDQNFWDTSRLQKGQSGILTSYVGGHQGRDLSKAKLNDYLKSADHIFKGLKNDYDHNLSAFNWTNYIHTKGSYACARPGDLTRFGEISSKVELEGRLLFAGEHATKEFAGFMNGAAMSGRKAAESILSKKLAQVL